MRPRPGNEFQVEEKFKPLGQPAQRVRPGPAQGLLLGRQGFEVVADPGEDDQVFRRVFGLVRRGRLVGWGGSVRAFFDGARA